MDIVETFFDEELNLIKDSLPEIKVPIYHSVSCAIHYGYFVLI